MLTCVYGQTQNKLALFLISANYILETKAVPRSLTSTTVNGAVIMVALVSGVKVCSLFNLLYCFVLHLRKHVAATFEIV